MDIFKTAETESGLSNDEIARLLEQALADWESRRGAVRNALIIPPDFTRFHSPRRSGRRCSATSHTGR